MEAPVEPGAIPAMTARLGAHSPAATVARADPAERVQMPWASCEARTAAAAAAQAAPCRSTLAVAPAAAAVAPPQLEAEQRLIPLLLGRAEPVALGQRQIAVPERRASGKVKLWFGAATYDAADPTKRCTLG